MKLNQTIHIEHGNICEYLKVTDCAVRWLSSRNTTFGIPVDGVFETEDQSPVAQGHIKNTSRFSIEDVVVDISYFDKQNRFIGLDMAGFFDIGFNELEPGQIVPFEVDLTIPDHTAVCYVNAAAKKTTADTLLKWLLRKD